MPIKSGIYVITNAQQGNPAFLESPDDEVPLRGYSKPENACEEVSALQFPYRIRVSRNIHTESTTVALARHRLEEWTPFNSKCQASPLRKLRVTCWFEGPRQGGR
jgi:hypothetical protein